MFCLRFMECPTWKDLKSICVFGKKNMQKKKKKKKNKELRNVFIKKKKKKKKKKTRRKWVLCKPMGPCGLVQGFVQDGSCTVFAGGSSGCIQVRKICSLFLSPLPGPTHCSFFRVKTSHCETKIHMPSRHSQLLAYNLHSWGPSKA